MDNQSISIDIRCPITTMIMKEPVAACDGVLYEKDAIQKWFRDHNKSPYTNKVIDKKIIPLIHIRNYIEDYVKKHPELDSEVYKPEKTHANYKIEINRIINERKFDKLKNYILFDFSEHICNANIEKLFACANVKTIKYVIDNTINLEKSRDYNVRLIHIICWNSSFEIIKYIIDKGVNLECLDNDEWAPIHYTCYKSSAKAIKYIISKNVFP